MGTFNTMCRLVGFCFQFRLGTSSPGSAVTIWRLIPVALTLAIGTLAWLRIDATEELIPDDRPEGVLETAAVVVV